MGQVTPTAVAVFEAPIWHLKKFGFLRRRLKA